MSEGIDPNRDDGDAIITCATCEACCCRLEVLLMGEDDVPDELTMRDRWGGTVMRRKKDGWCAALDRNSLRCTIYARRPIVCRDYEAGGGDCVVERRALRTAAAGSGGAGRRS